MRPDRPEERGRIGCRPDIGLISPIIYYQKRHLTSKTPRRRHHDLLYRLIMRDSTGRRFADWYGTCPSVRFYFSFDILY
jgi:hypothetical protein